MKNFTCHKVTGDKAENAPDYRLSINLGDKENPNWTDIGAGWLKEDRNGAKYISFTLKEPYKDKPGFRLEKVEGDKKPDYPDASKVDDIPF